MLTETWWFSLKWAKHLEIRAGARRTCIWTQSKWTPKNTVCWEGREHSSWCLFWGQEHECGGGRHPCDGSLTPWSGPECANCLGSVVHECPGAWKGPEQHPCTLWMSSVPKPGQREEPCIGKPSFQKRTEETCCAAEWPEYENRHLSGR